MKACFLLLAIVAAASCQSLPYVTAKTVKAVAQSSSQFKQVSPSLANCGGVSCSFYLSSTSCMSPFGPLSAYGPLGMLGPLQETSIDSTDAWSKLPDTLKAWQQQATANGAKLTAPGNTFASTSFNFVSAGAALSASGPLGPNGPLGQSINKMGLINGFAAQLAPLGVFTPLGPVGCLGALGPLGPLGPISLVASGFSRDDNGNYIDPEDNVARGVPLQVGSVKRNYQYYEWYDSAFAQEMEDNDASWMTRSVLSSGSTDTYPFSSPEDAIVTVNVVGEYQLDSFQISVQDSKGKTIVTSDLDSSSDLMNWIQIKLPKQTQFKIAVSGSFYGLWQHAYRLFVTATPQDITTNVSGPHIKTWNPIQFAKATTEEAEDVEEDQSNDDAEETPEDEDEDQDEDEILGDDEE